MKKLSLIFVVAIMMAVIVSCSKKQDDTFVQPNNDAKKVALVKGDYILKNGDITLKSAPVGQNITWTMLAKNTTFYPTSGQAPYYVGGDTYLIDGRELLTGTTAYNFWKTSAGNNPVNFSVATALSPGLYSNDTPDEDVRCIAETYDADDNLVYIGMIDFNPDVASFPLTVNGYRLGDELYVNWSQIKNLPATDALSLKVTYTVSPYEATATRAKAWGTLSTNGTPSGSKELGWNDLVYGTAAASQTFDVAGTGDISVYNSVVGKITGNVTVSLYEGAVLLSSVDVPAQGPGHGMRITATTTKVGAFDSGTINWHNYDILINGVAITYN